MTPSCVSLTSWRVIFLCSGLLHMPVKGEEMTQGLTSTHWFPSIVTLPGSHVSSAMRVTHTQKNTQETRPSSDEGQARCPNQESSNCPVFLSLLWLLFRHPTQWSPLRMCVCMCVCLSLWACVCISLCTEIPRPSVCVCAHCVTDLGYCMFAFTEEVRNIAALLQATCYATLCSDLTVVYMIWLLETRPRHQ